MGKQLTQEQVKEKLKEVHGNTISLIGDYKNSNTKVKFRCNAGLGHPDWEATTANVINGGSGCRLCGIKRAHDKVRKTLNNAQDELDRKFNGSITILKYMGARGISTFRCNAGLGHSDWEGSLYSLLNGVGCPECNILSHRMSIEPQIKERVYEYSNGAISMIGKFRGYHENTKFRCNAGLGHPDWEATPASILSGRKACHECRSFGVKSPKQYYDDFLRKHPEGNVSLVNNYVNNETEVELKCNLHSNHPNWKTSPYSALVHYKYCPICTNNNRGNNHRKPDSYYIREALPHVFGRGAILKVVRSKRYTTQLKVVCSRCGNEWCLPLSNLKQGQWCPKCIASRLENLVANILEVNDIQYTREYSVTVDGCVNRLDFVIPITPRGPYAVEADGRQHKDKNSNYYRDNYPIKDAQKDKWCEDNGYTMLRINSDNTTLPELMSIIKENLGYKSLQEPSITRYPTFKRDSEIAHYYLSHSSEETSNKYHVVRATVERRFKEIFGKAKKDYLAPSEKEVSEYYITHSVKETMNRFAIGNASVTRFFRRQFGCTKKEYLEEMKNINAE